MKKFPIARAKARLGVAFVEKIVAEAGSIFREYSQDTDLGIDGHIEFIDNGVATGDLIAIQIKAGSSYLKHYRNQCSFKVTVGIRDLLYWNSLPIPVVIVTYDPKTEQSGWLDIRDHIRDNPDILEHDSVTLTLPAKANQFNAHTLRSEIRSLCTKHRLGTGRLFFTELMASNDIEDKFRGFWGLRSRRDYLFTELSCFMLIQHIFHPNDDLRADVTDTVSRFLPHPEVGLIPPHEIREYIKSMLSNFGVKEVAWLLKTAWLDEENLMQRGSLGQSVGVIITAIPGYEQHLVRLIMDPNQLYEVRLAAIVLADEFGIESVLRAIAMNIDKNIWDELHETVKFIANEVLNIETGEINLAEIVARKGYDDDSLADLLNNSSLLFLCQNESNIAEIQSNTRNPLVKINASRALDRVARWKYHPEQYMKRLIA
jgi:hypothetical protein